MTTDGKNLFFELIIYNFEYDGNIYDNIRLTNKDDTFGTFEAKGTINGEKVTASLQFRKDQKIFEKWSFTQCEELTIKDADGKKSRYENMFYAEEEEGTYGNMWTTGIVPY